MRQGSPPCITSYGTTLAHTLYMYDEPQRQRLCAFVIKHKPAKLVSSQSRIRWSRRGSIYTEVFAYRRGAPHSGRTGHRMARRPPDRPLRRAVSSPTAKRAPRRRIFGLLRPAPGELQRMSTSGARLAGAAAANSPARRDAREFMPNNEPVAARDRSTGHVNRPPGAMLMRVAPPLCCYRQPPRGERRWRRETERPQCERARAHARRLAAGVQGR